MINLTNFKAVLKSLGFEENGHVLIKKFADGKTLLQADFHNKKLIYPTGQGLIVNGDFTCNFTSNENFVVFECVHRLLEKRL